MGGRSVSWGRVLTTLTAIAVLAIAGHADSRQAVGLAEGPSHPGTPASETSCRGRDDCTAPLKGGLRITFTGWACTTGFIARGVDDDDKLYVVTAGHCISGSGVFARWSHHGAVIGRAALDAFEGEPRMDAGAIEIPATTGSNELYASNRSDVRHITATMPDSRQLVGTEACRSGGTSDWTCGLIVRRDVATTINGHHLGHTWWTDFPSASGDSGSPMVDRQGRLLGIAIATTPTQTIYVPVDDVTAALDVRACLETDCR